jgi:hypothetical protein
MKLIVTEIWGKCNKTPKPVQKLKKFIQFDEMQIICQPNGHWMFLFIDFPNIFKYLEKGEVFQISDNENKFVNLNCCLIKPGDSGTCTCMMTLNSTDRSGNQYNTRIFCLDIVRQNIFIIKDMRFKDI